MTPAKNHCITPNLPQLPRGTFVHHDHSHSQTSLHIWQLQSRQLEGVQRGQNLQMQFFQPKSNQCQCLKLKDVDMMLCFLLIFCPREKKKKPKTKTTLFHWETHGGLMIWIDFWWVFSDPPYQNITDHHYNAPLKKYHRVPCLLGLPSIHHLHHSVDAWSPSELYHSEAQHVAAWSITVRLPFREQTNVSSTQMCIFEGDMLVFE